MGLADVFISYKTEEFEDANWVRSVLENHGISCWMAPASIPGGSSYAVEIPRAIHGCKVFVLILSEKSQMSKWVPRELDQAINDSKTVMPFMLENCALKDDFNFYLTNVQRYAAYESKARAAEKMVREIKAILAADEVGVDEVGVDADAGSGAGVGTAVGIGAGAEAGEKSGAVAGAGERTVPGAKSGAAAVVGAGAGSGAGTGAGAQTGERIGANVQSDPGRDAGEKARAAVAEAKTKTRDRAGARYDIEPKAGGRENFCAGNGAKNPKKTPEKPPRKWEKPPKSRKGLLFAGIGAAALLAALCALLLLLPGRRGGGAGQDRPLQSGGQASEPSHTPSDAPSGTSDTPSGGDTAGITFGDESFAPSETMVTLREIALTQDDIDKFAKFFDLNIVRLEDCQISAGDLRPLLRPAVHTLELSDCALTQAQFDSLPFSEATELLTLDVGGNPALTSLSSLAALPNSLGNLTITGTGISTLTDLAGMTKMTSLYANGLGITDLTPLSDCDDLMTLSLDGNGISDLTPLAGCKELARLSVNGNALTSLAGLEDCISLARLQAGNNQIVSLDGLVNATVLAEVFLSDNQIEDISPLAKSAATLQRLYLRGNRVKSLEPLSLCTALVSLNLDGNAVTSLTPLAGCEGMKGLSAENNQITSPAGLENMRALEYLDLAQNGIVVPEGFVIPMAAGAQLVVNLSGNPLTRLPLPEGGKYRFLNLHGVSVADYGAIYAEQGYGQAVLDYSESIDLERLAGARYGTCTLVGVPLDKQLAVEGSLGKFSVVFLDADAADAACAEMMAKIVTDAIKGVAEY